MLRALIQLAPKVTTASDVPLAVRELQVVAEFPAAGERAYIIEPGPGGTLRATAIEVDESSRFRFPFRRPPGPRSPQIGPILKRTMDPKKGVGPNATTIAATLAHFESLANAGAPASRVYRAVLDSLGAGTAVERTARVGEALAAIPEKKTVYVSLGTPPGDDADYAAHVLEVVSSELYGIDEATPLARCPICQRNARLGANALRGAKLNFLNMDNHGFFAGFDVDRASDRFAVCAACASAIASTYIHQRAKLRAYIAGASALVLPYIVAPAAGGYAARTAADILDKIRTGKGTDAAEGDLLSDLAEESSLASFHILWATTGDSLDDVTGFITDVPCTRLGILSARNKIANAWTGGVLPMRRARPFDLRLSLVADVFAHPGGKRTERRNGLRLAAVRKQIARSVYLAAPMAVGPLMHELRDIIADYLVDPTVEERYVASNFTFEPPPPKKAGAEVRMNAASWIRHAALLLHYLRDLEVLPPMTNAERYVPRSERLQKLVTPPSGIDTDEKMFAFVTGILFGRVLVEQSKKGVNVRSNALTWLRRGTLTGRDLPGLYVKIREKFSEYESERWSVLRDVVTDASELGRRLGTNISLDADTAMYFIFLGQALAGDVFNPKETPMTAEGAP
ncbi:MAG: hypothetical protein IPM54_06620 [Polyangiaceae bacterium]|nr:hypothetical protein [Polyangiaceae bacterium]